jgi:20S proteasome alpha/beta subunit
MMEYKATAEGEGRDAAIEYFEKNYEEGLSRDDAIILGLKALIYATEKKLEKRAVEVGIVDEQRKFRILTADETEKYFEKAKGE